MSKGTVVLLHGLSRTKYSMVMLERDLRKAGYRVLNYGYRSRHYTIDKHAELFAEYLSKNVDPAEELSFVTHSLGGIVLRRLAQLYGEKYNLKRAVMLGPPNQGSSFAYRIRKFAPIRWFLGEAFSELCTLNMDSSLGKLDIGILAGGKNSTKGYSPFISGDNDGIVAVDETRLNGASAHRVVPALHTFIMNSRSVRLNALAFLETGKFATDEQ